MEQSSNMLKYDRIIIGAGIYGLYSALYLGKKKEKVLVIEKDDNAFMRATYINQARVHQGYHYPRSLSTAKKSANYFERFNTDYNFCINSKFEQIYATSTNFSWTDAKQFKDFCDNANIPCKEVSVKEYFKKGMCDGAFLTEEYTYDAMILRNFFLEEISKISNISILYNMDINTIEKDGDIYKITTSDNKIFASDFILNATYGSVNQIINKLPFELIKIKYELCEIILLDVCDKLKNIGITVMDGPFFSIMPFGKTNTHSLTSVTFTPHMTSYKKLPQFLCQCKSNGYCSSDNLGNCNECIAKPITAFPYMSSLANKYLKEEYSFVYKKSLFSMKPILLQSEIDDSRPTVIKIHSQNPTFISVLSGKINTVYDLDEVLNDK